MTIENRYRNRGLQRGTELYLPAEVASEYVSDCESENVAVLRIEGFSLKGNELRPRMDLICDFSPRDSELVWEEYRAQVNKQALSFLSRVPLGESLVFSLVVLSPEETTRKS